MAIQTKSRSMWQSASRIGASGGQPLRGRLASRDLPPAPAGSAGESAGILRALPKAAYMTEIESWRKLADDEIEFVMRRLPTAD